MRFACARARAARDDALLNARTLELRDRGKDAGDEPTGRRAGVDALAERHKCDPARLPIVEQHHEVTQVSTESIEPARPDAGFRS